MRRLFNPNNLQGKEFDMLTKFWKEYGKLFDAEDYYNLRHNLLRGYEVSGVPLKFLSIYSYLNILETNRDIYAWFLSFLRTYYHDFLDKNILEVSCGKVPALVKMIADAIDKKNSEGTITGIDSALVIKCIPNATLLKESLTNKTDLSPYNTIIGVAPCEAAPIAIKGACINKKELSLVLCGCIHMDGECFYPTYEKYLNHLYNIVKYHISSDFEYDISAVPKCYNYEYPVLSLKRK